MILINSAKPNIERLLVALNAVGFSELGIRKDGLTKPDAAIQLGYAPSPIDLLSSIDGVHIDQCFVERVVWPVDGIARPSLILPTSVLINLLREA